MHGLKIMQCPMHRYDHRGPNKHHWQVRRIFSVSLPCPAMFDMLCGHNCNHSQVDALHPHYLIREVVDEVDEQNEKN